MIHTAKTLKFLQGTSLEVTFIDGRVIRYDMAVMFNKYPQLKALTNRDLFLKGHLDKGGYGIIWNDELDFSASSIYENGELVREESPELNKKLGEILRTGRLRHYLSQEELARLSKIDQGDISRFEKGQGNPTLKKIAVLFDCLDIEIKEVVIGYDFSNAIKNPYAKLLKEQNKQK